MTGIAENDLSGRLEILRYNDQKFTMKLEREENRLAILEDMWSGIDKPYKLPCVACSVIDLS